MMSKKIGLRRKVMKLIKNLKQKQGISFQPLLILCISGLLSVTALLLLAVPARLYASLYEEQAKGYCGNIVYQTSVGISQAITAFDVKINRLADAPVIRSILSSPAAAADMWYEYKTAVSDHFVPQTIDDYYLQELDLYIKGVDTVLQYGSKPLHLPVPFESSYYHHSLIYPVEMNWLGYNTADDCIDITKVLYDYSTYEVQGFFVIRLSKDFLLDKFEAFNTIDPEQLYILDDKGTVLCSNSTAYLGQPFPYLYEQLAGEQGSVKTKDHMIVYSGFQNISTDFPYRNWTAAITLDQNKLLKDFRRILYLFIGITAGIIAAGVFITVYLSRYVTHPIEHVVQAMNEVEHENLQVRLADTHQIREIRSINHGFNRMTIRLDTLINTVYKTQLAQKEAQLKILRSQINPHFLFNTLQLISWKAYEYEAYQVCEMIDSLSYMLQTDLETGDDNWHTLRDEMEYIRHYERIIHCKYENKITFNFQIPDELLDCRIPKLIIQPFLENSVSHGLAPKDGEGYVTLRVSGEEQVLTAVIADDGVGMRGGLLAALQDPVPPSRMEEADAKGHHIALSNIQNRIHILYGEPYGFEIESRLYEGTVVTLRIPLEKGDRPYVKSIDHRR